MATITFDPSKITGFEPSAHNTLKTMAEVAGNALFPITFDPSTKKFTLLNSSYHHIRVIRALFEERFYEVWQPRVLNETDRFGNKVIELEPKLKPVSWLIDHSVRGGIASALMECIQNSMSISLKGKNCIDIGCRSGENTLALQKGGANVIGIDPDDSEFGMAKEKGMKDAQLIKATLQKYRKSFPHNNFDLATVFLWNIPLAEQKFFMSSLAEIIRPDGCVIIGYHEDEYNTAPYNLPQQMQDFFDVVKFEFPLNLNRYMFICNLSKNH